MQLSMQLPETVLIRTSSFDCAAAECTETLTNALLLKLSARTLWYSNGGTMECSTIPAGKASFPQIRSLQAKFRVLRPTNWNTTATYQSTARTLNLASSLTRKSRASELDEPSSG
jgi:hypothetical protein